VIHSDRGSQFRSHTYVQELRRHRLHGSMGRVGACADNAALESYFSLLHRNVLNRRRWQTREHSGWRSSPGSKRTYHRRRRQNSHGRLTPIELETMLQTAQAA
jgi:transposase InsO family protein